MAYDAELAGRASAMLQDVVGGHPEVVEKRLFGGVGLMLAGNMAVGVRRSRCWSGCHPTPWRRR